MRFAQSKVNKLPETLGYLDVDVTEMRHKNFISSYPGVKNAHLKIHPSRTDHGVASPLINELRQWGSGPRKSKINWRYLQCRFRSSSPGDCSVISERLNNTRAIFRRPPLARIVATLPLRFSWREAESPIINYPLAGYVTVGLFAAAFFFFPSFRSFGPNFSCFTGKIFPIVR